MASSLIEMIFEQGAVVASVLRRLRLSKLDSMPLGLYWSLAVH